MVKIMENYITEIYTKEELDEVGENDELYIETEDGTYHIYPKSKLQADYDGVTFVNYKGINQYDYEDICIYRVKGEYMFLNQTNTEIEITVLFLGIVIGFVLSLFIGGI